jgi:hypothetical protein
MFSRSLSMQKNCDQHGRYGTGVIKLEKAVNVDEQIHPLANNTSYYQKQTAQP